MGTLKDQGQAGTAGTAIETLLWVIVGTTITLLGMALGALVLMNNGAINERLRTVTKRTTIKGGKEEIG